MVSATNDANFGDEEAVAFLEDANALLVYVKGPNFPTTGSVSADPVQQMLDDCFQQLACALICYRHLEAILK